MNFCNNCAEPWKTEQEYVHYSTEPYLDKFSSLLDRKTAKTSWNTKQNLMVFVSYWEISKIRNTDLQFRSPGKVFQTKTNEEKRQFKELWFTNKRTKWNYSRSIHEPEINKWWNDKYIYLNSSKKHHFPINISSLLKFLMSKNVSKIFYCCINQFVKMIYPKGIKL